jgi:hypothetical protein
MGATCYNFQFAGNTSAQGALGKLLIFFAEQFNIANAYPGFW